MINGELFYCKSQGWNVHRYVDWEKIKVIDHKSKEGRRKIKAFTFDTMLLGGPSPPIYDYLLLGDHLSIPPFHDHHRIE